MRTLFLLGDAPAATGAGCCSNCSDPPARRVAVAPVSAEVGLSNVPTVNEERAWAL